MCSNAHMQIELLETKDVDLPYTLSVFSYCLLAVLSACFIGQLSVCAKFPKSI